VEICCKQSSEERILMYDFYFGTKEEVDSDPKKFLLTIKRMLPRWCNSIPDSEYLALYDVISGMPFTR
tara:strand:- start:172 stop:375 length:204 start_codon:yes stop_codon:yes gene_type:complete